MVKIGLIFLALGVCSSQIEAATKYKCRAKEKVKNKISLEACVQVWLKTNSQVKSYLKKNNVKISSLPTIYKIREMGDAGTCGKDEKGDAGETSGTLLVVLPQYRDLNFVTTSALRVEFTRTFCRTNSDYKEEAWINSFKKLELRY